MTDDKDRKKAEHDRLHKQKFVPWQFGFAPSIHMKSEQNMRYIKQLCEKAVHLATGGPKLVERYSFEKVKKQDIFDARTVMGDAQQAFDDPMSHPQLHHVEWVGEHKQEAFLQLKKARETLRYAAEQVEMYHIHRIDRLRNEAWDLYQRASDDWHRTGKMPNVKPRDVFAKLKETQALIRESFLTKVNREDQLSKVQSIWRQVSDFAAKVNEAWQQRQEQRAARDVEFAKKHAEWRERQEQNIARWESRISNSRSFIHRMQTLIATDEERLSNARSSEFADKVRGWIDEKQAKIDDTEKQIAELEDRVRDVRDRLDKDGH